MNNLNGASPPGGVHEAILTHETAARFGEMGASAPFPVTGLPTSLIRAVKMQKGGAQPRSHFRVQQECLCRREPKINDGFDLMREGKSFRSVGAF